MAYQIKHKTQVLIVGGGTAGSVAAIAAARCGVKVTLVERYGFLGGLLTGGLVGPMMSFHAGSQQVVQGIPHEVVERLKTIGASPGHVHDTTGFCSTVTPFDPEGLKKLFFEMCVEEQVELFLHTLVTDVIIQDGAVQGVVGFSPTGAKLMFLADSIVDSTGDGNIAALAGAEFIIGRSTDGLTQPATLMIRMGGVCLERVLDYMRAHPEEFRISPEVNLDSLKPEDIHSVNGFYSLVRKAQHAGDLSFPCSRVLFFPGVRKGEVTVNMTRVHNVNSLVVEDLSKAEIITRKQVDEVVYFLKKYIPGFEEAFVIDTGAFIGIRESRHIVGDYILTMEDILHAKRFETAIACGGYPIDIHRPDEAGIEEYHPPPGEYYTIPFECLLPRGIAKLLVAGRCISATHEAAGAIRVSPIAMATGQAAGVAAALSVLYSVEPRKLDIALVQQKLREQKSFIPI